MKKIIFYFIILFEISANSQTFTININYKYCESNKSNSQNRNLSIISYDSLVIKNIKTRFGKSQIKELKQGSYKLKFTNIFGQTIKKEIDVSKKNQHFTFCIDEFQENNKKTLFGKLKDNDHITIDFSSSGCFHSNEEKMEIYYEQGRLIAKLYINRKVENSKILENKKLKCFIDFEKKVKEMKNAIGGCTTANYYALTLNNNKEFSVIDRSCDWDGYLELKKIIFNNE